MSEPLPAHRGAPSWPYAVAALVCLAQALALVAFCGFFLYELVVGAGDDPARVVMSVVLMGIFAVALLAFARSWWRGSTARRTPTVLWNVLLLPVTWSLVQAGSWVAWPVGLSALVGIAAAVLAREPDGSAPTGRPQ